MLAKHEVIAILQEHGITPTRQRLEIGSLLFAKPQHLSAEQMLELTRTKGKGHVSKATVYNTLNLFARKGLLREIIVDPTKVFYDSNISEHHHIYNMDTGELSDVDGSEVMVSGLPSLPKGTVTAGVEVIFRVRSEAATHH